MIQKYFEFCNFLFEYCDILIIVELFEQISDDYFVDFFILSF